MRPRHEGERRERMVAIRITKLCEVCGADLRPSGMVRPTAPPQYVHECSVHPDHPMPAFAASYPAIVFEPEASPK